MYKRLKLYYKLYKRWNVAQLKIRYFKFLYIYLEKNRRIYNVENIITPLKIILIFIYWYNFPIVTRNEFNKIWNGNKILLLSYYRRYSYVENEKHRLYMLTTDAHLFYCLSRYKMNIDF
jgi:hypothetical protein